MSPGSKQSSRRRKSAVAAFALGLTCAVVLLGCSEVIDRSQMIGSYEARHQNGVEILTLRPDDTYILKFSAVDSSESTSSGKWEFEPFEGEPKVALHNFSSHLFKQPQVKADLSLLDIENRWGRIRLFVSHDLDQYYLKK